jgi:hypothetical protein
MSAAPVYGALIVLGRLAEAHGRWPAPRTHNERMHSPEMG